MFFKPERDTAHKLLDYIRMLDSANLAFQKGFLDNGTETHLYDVYDNYLNDSMKMVQEIEMDESDWIIYEYDYNPKKLSNDVYKTPDMWRIILDLNGCKHPGEFARFERIKLLTPESFEAFTHKIYELKKQLLMNSDSMW